MDSGKRVLINLEVDPEKEPYYAFVSSKFILPPNPETVRLAKQYAVVYTKEEKKETKPILAYANPLGWGYGGGETPWPFSYQKALHDGRYRAGIRNAINSNWVSQNWRLAARRLLTRVLDELIAEYDSE